jgi:putative spermidine/putrescine transport system permease protein
VIERAEHHHGWWVLLLTALTLVFLIAPLVILLVQSFTAESYLSFPPTSYGLRWYRHIFVDGAWRRAILLSVAIATTVTPLSLGLGTAAALALDRGPLKGRRAIYLILISPMILPGVVLGLGLLRAFLWLDLTDQFLGFALAHLTVTVPYAVITVGASLASFDRSVEEAARSLGAAPWRAVWHVTLPMIRPGLVGAGIFALITSFDEFIITYFLATYQQTLPIQIFNSLSYQLDPSIAAVSGLTIMITALLTTLLVFRGLVASGGRILR